MYKVIRVSADYAVVIVQKSLSGNEEDANSEYFMYNRNLMRVGADNLEKKADDGNVECVFERIQESKKRMYFSPMSDCMGKGELPSSYFNDLYETWKWIREKQQVEEPISLVTIDV